MHRKRGAFERGNYDPARFLRPDTVAAIVATLVAAAPDGHLNEVVIQPAR
jgi:hypothetical protein